MTSPVLFSTGASPTATTSRNLVEFKAGKMELRDKLVHPIKRQGLVYLRQSPDDNLMHFCWKDRQSGVVEDDLILFPDDCEFKRVKECTTGRVFVLKMKSSNKKMFFWMQESRIERDDEFCKKINEMLNNPPRSGSDMGSSSERGDLSALFGNMSQDQINQLLNSSGVNLASLLNAAGRSPSSNSGTSASSTASTTNSSAPTSATSGGHGGNVSAAALAAAAAAAANSGTGESSANVNLNDFRALISGALMEGNEEEADALMQATLQASRGETGGASSGGGQNRDPNASLLIDLSTAMNSESLLHLLQDQDFLRQIEPHLPPVTQSTSTTLTEQERRDQFSETIRSSQFRSSLSQFCVALQSGQLGPLMSQFGLNQACVEAADMGNLEAFVQALETQTRGGSTGSANAPPASGQHPSEKQDKS